MNTQWTLHTTLSSVLSECLGEIWSCYEQVWLYSDNKDSQINSNSISIRHSRIGSMSYWYWFEGLCSLGISLQQWKDASLHRKRQVWVVMISLFLAYECIDGLMQERRNSIANALELCLSWTNQLVWSWKADFPHRKWIVRKVFSKHAIIMTFQHQSYPLTPCYLCWKKEKTLSHLRGLPWTCPALWFTQFSKKYASFSQSCLLVVGYRRMFFIMGTRLGHKM